MPFNFRSARPEEMGQFGMIGAYVYAGSFGDGPDNIVSASNLPDWTLCAFDGDRMAASFSTIPFTMRAAGKAIPMGGISAVGTLPEYRRRGLMRELMSRALRSMYEGARPVAALWASQAAIYQRYGFAMSSVKRHYRIDTVDIGFHDGDGGHCEVARIDPVRDFDLLKQLYIQFIQHRIGYLHRSSALWRLGVMNETPAEGPVHAAIARNEQGEALGYVIYTMRSGKVQHLARGQEIRIRDFVWLNADALRSLWRFLATHDLVGAIDWPNVPMDDPAMELMSEPRLLNARDNEGCWYRLVDAAAAIQGRGYRESGHLRIKIHDDTLSPWNNGTWAIDISPEGATVGATAETPDISLSIKALTSLYMGFRSAAQLANWGLVTGDADSIRATDRLFATPSAPHCPDNF